jgi:redox-sensitive bicupin YhaK (pirin superfamily)
MSLLVGIVVDMTTFTSDVTVLHQAEQFQAAPFGGVFRANKPVVGGHSADGQLSAGLFYWSHSRFHDDFEFGLHHHEGFEIATFILEGENSHYDTATRQWVDLHAGDVQIIRSGSGVSHNERVAKGSRAFQIWWDPGYHEALRDQPSYTDHAASAFTPHSDGDAFVTDLIGGDGPVLARTEGLSVQRIAVPAGARADLEVGPHRFTLGYLIAGIGTVDGVAVTDNDAVSLNGASAVTVSADAPIDIFVVSVPAKPSYQPIRQG